MSEIEPAQLNNWDRRILQTLEVAARDVAPVTGARMAAAVAIRGTIISMGNNSLKSHPFQNRFGKNSESMFWHAETHAVHNFLRKHLVSELVRSTLYVVRVKPPRSAGVDWSVAMARPCRGCTRCIWDHGIPRVIYSNAQGGYSCEGSV